LREKRVAVNENELRPYLGQLVVANKVDGEVLRGKFQRTHPSVLELKGQEGRGYDYEVLGEEHADDPAAEHQLVRADEILSIRRSAMNQEEAERELERLKRSREIEPLLTAQEWRGSLGYDVMPYGRFGLLPNPYPPNPKPLDGTEFRLVYQDFDTSRTVDITGWSAAEVFQLVKDRATADGLPFPPPRA
jgi:hypothetical protein